MNLEVHSLFWRCEDFTHVTVTEICVSENVYVQSRVFGHFC